LTPLTRSTNFQPGTPKSKSVSEKLLQRAVLKGMPLTTIRAGVVSGNSKTGIWSKNQWLPQALAAVHESKLVPEEFLSLELKLTPVDHLSRILVAATGQCSKKLRRVQAHNPILHLAGETFTLGSLIELHPHPKIESVPYDEWLTRMTAAADRGDDRLAGLLSIFPKSTNDMADLVPDVSTQWSDHHLESLGLSRPTMDHTTIARYWEYVCGVLSNKSRTGFAASERSG
jgi:thioester reductase-like protein